MTESPIAYILSTATAIAIAQCVEALIAREYGRDSLLLAAALEAAEAGLYTDAREAFLEFNGGERGLNGWVNIQLQILMTEGLAARECQCRQLGAARLDRNHGHADLDVCHRHYEADVPPLAGLLLCGDCHVAEWQAGTR